MSLIANNNELGAFWWDDDVFEMVVMDDGKTHLHHRDSHKGDIFKPKGIEDMSYLFYGNDLTGCQLRDFYTGCVKNMSHLFEKCVIPDDLYLGQYFETTMCEDMSYMFADTTIPKSFTLGNKFSTDKVVNMSKMFYNTIIEGGFTLGKHFTTENVKQAVSMFEGCQLPASFTLGDEFYISSEADTKDMFVNCMRGDAPIATVNAYTLRRIVILD